MSKILVQIELGGIVAEVTPSSELHIDTDFDESEALHIQIKDDRLVIWGGVAAGIVED